MQRMHGLAGAAFALALAAATPAGAAAEKRIALVIGNGAYRNVPALINPANDAADVAAALTRLGFSVTRLADADFDAMRRTLIAFGAKARGVEMAVVFFAGHGMEIGGENWLIPVDAELKTDTAAEHEALSLRSVIQQVAQAGDLGLVILDACRNNPFAARMQRSLRARAVEQGLSRIEPAGNVLVAYAARDGTIALDGEGRNSPFTTALLRNMETPGLEITFMFRNVRDDVLDATGNRQQPFVYGSLSRKAVYLAEPTAAAPALAAEAERIWPSVRDTASIAVLDNYVQQFAGTVHGSMARARLDELKRAAALGTAAQDRTPVESRVVGTWEILVPNNRGIARWVWSILPDGTYRFRSEGAGAVPAHEGEVGAKEGRWWLRATKGLVGWDDGGAYELRDHNTLLMSGRLGSGLWRRVD